MNTDIYRAALLEARAELWAILPDRLASMLVTLGAAAAGGSAPEAARPEPARHSGAVAIVPVSGPIFSRGGGLLAELFGGTSSEQLALTMRRAAADPAVSAIVLDINSPGGAVAGVTEAAAAIRDAASQKPVVAVANHLAASAAYWLAAQASQLVVTPSGEVGSIGVFAAHQDWSKAMEQMGVTVSLISAGKYKTEGNPYEPLSDEARGAIQARVDDYYKAFTADVAKGRKVAVETVRGGFGEGRVVGAREAVREGMADGVGTLGDAVAAAARLAGERLRSPSAELEFRQRRARAVRE